MVSLDKCSGRCNSADDLSMKICVPSKTKDVNVKVFNMITNRNETKTMLKHISCDCKCKLNSTTCNSNQKWNNKTCHYECKSVKIIVHVIKTIIVGILAHGFVKIVSI